MALDIKDAIRSELRDEGFRGKKYKKRRTLYCFSCIECNEEFWAFKGDFGKLTGKCWICARKQGTKITAIKISKRPFESLFNHLLYNCKRYKKETDLTYEDFIEFTKEVECCYCKSKIEWFENSLCKNGYKYNLDRKDSSIGYLKENIVVCCWKCNKSKSNILTYEEMKVAMKAVMEYRNARSGK